MATYTYSRKNLVTGGENPVGGGFTIIDANGDFGSAPAATSKTETAVTTRSGTSFTFTDTNAYAEITKDQSIQILRNTASTVALEGNKTYVLDFDAKGTGTLAATFGGTTFDLNGATAGSTLAINNADWTSYRFYVTAADKNAILKLLNTATGTLQIDNVSLEKTIDASGAATTTAETAATAFTGLNTANIDTNGATAGGAANTSVADSFTGSIFDDVIDMTQTANAGAAGGNDTVVAGRGHDTVTTGAGNDVVDLGIGHDAVTLGSGNDWAYGDAGRDTLSGGAGDDTLVGGAGGDQMDGGDGKDFVSYANINKTTAFSVSTGFVGSTVAVTAGVVVDLTDFNRNYGDARDDRFTSIEGVIGSNVADYISGTLNGDDLRGEGGNDTLDGANGADTLLGGAGDDVIAGGQGADSIDGGQGSDVYLLQSLMDLRDGDSIADSGTTGTDIVRYQEANNVVRTVAVDTTARTLTVSYEGESLTYKVGTGVEQVQVYTGSTNGVAQYTSYTLGTGGGTGTAPAVDGYTGTGTGTAADPYVYAATGLAVTFDATKNSALAAAPLRVTGSSSHDVITTGSKADVVIGGAGNDTINGGADWDWLDFRTQTTGGVSVTLNGATDAIVTHAGSNERDVIRNIEGLRVGSGNDSLVGDAVFNSFVLEGGGNDTVDGGAGTDQLFFFGNDANVTLDLSQALTATSTNGTVVIGTKTNTLRVTNIETVVTAGGNDKLTGNAVANSLDGGAGNDTVIGNAGSDTLTGGTGNDSLNAGADTDEIYGGAGNDTIDGGAGFDWVDFRTQTTGGVSVTLNGATDAIVTHTGSTERDTIRNIEAIRVGSGNDSLVGDSATNSFVLQNGGNDTVNGGAGVDRITFWGDNANVTLDLSATGNNGTVVIGTKSNTLRVSSVEDIVTAGGADKLTGSTGANLFDSGAGNDTLSGGAGNDTLDGGAGSDVLTGGAGNDTFVFKSAVGTTNIDVIVDFSSSATGNDDTFRLDNDVFTALTTLGTLASANFLSSATAVNVSTNTAAQAIIYDQTSGAVYYNANGATAGGLNRIATLQNKAAITASDFFVID